MDLWHLEISDKKSKILIYGESFNANRRWTLGSYKTSPNTEVEISLAEVSEIKYLGVIISRNNDVFRLHKRNFPSIFRKNKWLVTVPSERLGRRLWFGSYLWKIYVMPILLHSCEVFTYDKQTIRHMEVGQNDILRAVCHADQCTPIMSLYAMTKTSPVLYEIRKRQMGYVHYLSQLDQNRVVFQAFKQQQYWYQSLDSDTTGMGIWLSTIFAFATEIELPYMEWWVKSKIRVAVDSYFLVQYQRHRDT